LRGVPGEGGMMARRHRRGEGIIEEGMNSGGICTGRGEEEHAREQCRRNP
jgi:hypothetical protein